MINARKLDNCFLACGLRENMTGTDYARRAVMMYRPDMRMTKELYPAIAAAVNTTPGAVERAIRHAIETGFDRCGYNDEVMTMFGNTMAVPLHPAVDGLQALASHEAVEVIGPVLVPFRNKDVSQTMPPHHVIAPAAQCLDYGGPIVAVDFRRVKGQRHEEVEAVRKCQPPKLGPGPAHGAHHVGPLGFLPLFPGARDTLRVILAPPGDLPPRFPEDRSRADKHVRASVWVVVNQPIMGDFMDILDHPRSHSDGIMS